MHQMHINPRASSSDVDRVNLRQHVDRVSEVCPLPASAQRVLTLSEDPNASFEEIGRAIAADPALAAEVMRLASSPALATRTPAHDLATATQRIGLREVRDMASAMAMLTAFSSDHELALHIHEQALVAGMLAAGLASTLGHRQPRSVYLCGLLSDIGALACVAVDGGAYIALRHEAGLDHDRRAAYERERYGGTSWQLGAALLRRNGLADSLCDTVAGDVRADDLLAVAITRFVRRSVPTIVEASRRRDPSWAPFAHQNAQAVGLDLDEAALVRVVLDAGADALAELELVCAL